MKNNILASIALFGNYRNKNQDTYDLVAQFINAIIAQKEYSSFTPEIIQLDLKELYQIDIPLGVIKSVCKNRIDRIALNNGVFTCARLPKDSIEKEYETLTEEYEGLFLPLLEFVKSETTEFKDKYIKDCFADYLVEGYTSEICLNSLYAAFILNNSNNIEIRKKIDLLSSGLISYKGLSYTDSTANSGAWTERLVVFLDTEYLFNCAGYNGKYHQTVFNELYGLINEVNSSYRSRTKKLDNLIELRYLRDTYDVYLNFYAMAKGIIDSRIAPDPSKKALMNIISECESSFEVEGHRARIDSIILNNYGIVYDDRDYDRYVTDPRYVMFDQDIVSGINKDYNPEGDEIKSRKIDYYSRIYTIIKGLRGGKEVKVFEQCRYIFLTGSRIGRGTSLAVRNDNKTVPLATDIDFLVSRLWFKLNKQLVNNRIPFSIDIVARSQAVLTREVSRKVKTFYDQLVQKDYSEVEKKIMYANLKTADVFLEPYDMNSIKDVLSFIEYSDIDELMISYKNQKKAIVELEVRNIELKASKEELSKKEKEILALQKDKEESEIWHQKQNKDVSLKNKRLKLLSICLLAVIFVLISIILVLFVAR